MINIDIRDDFKEAASGYALLLTSGEMEQAITRALNKAITAARTDSVKAVRDIYKTRAKDVRKTFKLKKAFGSNLSAELVSTGQPLSAYGFLSARNTPHNIGASINVKGVSKPIAGAFIAKVASPSPDGGVHIGIFVRTGKFGLKGNPKRERIRELFTVSVPQSLANQVVEASVDKAVADRLPGFITHELDFAVLLKTGKVKLGRR